MYTLYKIAFKRDWKEMCLRLKVSVLGCGITDNIFQASFRGVFFFLTFYSFHNEHSFDDPNGENHLRWKPKRKRQGRSHRTGIQQLFMASGKRRQKPWNLHNELICGSLPRIGLELFCLQSISPFCAVNAATWNIHITSLWQGPGCFHLFTVRAHAVTPVPSGESLTGGESRKPALWGGPKLMRAPRQRSALFGFFTLHFSLLPLQSISRVLNSFLILIDANSILKTVISPGLLKNMFAYCDSNV